MARVVIKIHRRKNLYVIWSSERDQPVAVGTRREVMRLLGGDIPAGRCPTCQSWVPRDATPAAALARADEHGGSDRSVRFGWWDDELLPYAMEGHLRRTDLAKAARLIAEGREAEVRPLLVPYDDEDAA